MKPSDSSIPAAERLPAAWATLRRRWDLLAIALLASLLYVIPNSASTYFLHFDTPLMNLAAQEWARGCFGYYANQILPIVLLTPFYKLGSTHLWEAGWLLIGASVTVASVYELTRLLGSSKLAGLLAALLVLALPSFQYFSRTHLGYAMPLLIAGWLALYHDRWVWAGVCFGLAITAHYNSWVPIGLAGITLMAFDLRPAAWKKWLGFGLAFLAPLLAADVLFLAYRGHLFEWNRGVFTEALRLSGSEVASPLPDWLWVVRTVVGSNGPALSMALAFGALSPLKVRRGKIGLALSVTFILVAAVYTLQGGLGRSLLVPRLLATAYPVWSVAAGLGFQYLLELVPRDGIRRAAAGVAGIGLLWGIASTAVFMAEYGQTPYPQINQWFAEAARQGRPVRYAGNWLIGMLYAQQHGVEALIEDPLWLEENAPGQAVLIFATTPPASLSREGYIIETVDTGQTIERVHPGLTSSPPARHAEVWWPTSDTWIPLEKERGEQRYVVYYAGSGCLAQPIYGYGTQHFYQLVWSKVVAWLGIGS